MMVAFFPWLAIERDLDLGSVTLVPYARGRTPAGDQAAAPDARTQGLLDALFDHYFSPYQVRPLNHATLIQYAGHRITDELGEPELEEVFAVAELVAFGGLAARNFFGSAFAPLGHGVTHYSNAHTFQPYVQSFPDVPGGASTSVRRRDGSQGQYICDDSNRVYAPKHVAPQEVVALDEALIRALLAARDKLGWDRFDEAIGWFNAANTDSEYTREHIEAVMMVGAFARLLGIDGTKIEKPLAARFTDVLRPVRELPASGAGRGISADLAKGSVREAWMRDFVRVRHQPAHGRLALRQSSWPLAEHLLLAGC